MIKNCTLQEIISLGGRGSIERAIRKDITDFFKSGDPCAEVVFEGSCVNAASTYGKAVSTLSLREQVAVRRIKGRLFLIRKDVADA